MPFFEIFSERGEFGLAHPHYGISMGRWSGDLHYRMRGQIRIQDMDLVAIEVEDKKVVSLQGDHLKIELTFHSNGVLTIDTILENTSIDAITLEKLSLSIGDLNIGGYDNRYSFFKNGYQSWTTTHAFSREEREMVPILPPMNNMQDNLRNLPSKRRGAFFSDMFSVIGNLDKRIYLLIGQAGGFRHFLYIRVRFPGNGDKPPSLELVYDLGGKVMPAGSVLNLDRVVVIADNHANRIQDTYFDLIRTRGSDTGELPTGWCSWYYYFTKITQDDLYENLKAARERRVAWRYFVLDDGYQESVGDWLLINGKFPDGLKAVSERIRTAGMTPGLWLAPFIARRNSQLYREHDDWFLKDGRGKPVLAGWNPNWGLGGNFYAMDITHPDFQNYIRELIHTVVHGWGYRYLKLDFVYAASLYGLARDPTLSSAERLQLGYRIIREAAGRDVFLLGCGSPLSAAIGFVDAMRIGPDVAPYWFARYRYHLTRDPHALCTKFAIRSILNRCQMHRKLWINDPDCLLLRDSNTKLTSEERMSLANAIIISGGMYVMSDKLTALSPGIWEWMREIEGMVRSCDEGRAWPLDYMERGMPELVYNSKGYLAVFNFKNREVYREINLRQYLADILNEGAQCEDVWDGKRFSIDDGIIDIGGMKPHSSRLLKVE
jgi:alpha-galactosidase